MSASRRRVIIDTDIGTDVDDLWTLAMVPGRDDMVLEAITLVYGDTDLRARITAVALAGMGIDVPVYRGREVPIGGKALLWGGHEGVGISGLESARYTDGDAVDVLIERVAADPGSLDVVAIGPLTNIAQAIELDPMFVRNVRHLMVMGGEFANGLPEHNFCADGRATRIVVGSGIPMTVMPLDQTLRVMITRDDTLSIARHHPIGALMADQAERFWKWLVAIVPGASGFASAPHDPSALLTLLEPELVTLTPMAIHFLDDDPSSGRITGVRDASSSIRVVTDLDPVAMHTAIMCAMGVPLP